MKNSFIPMWAHPILSEKIKTVVVAVRMILKREALYVESETRFLRDTFHASQDVMQINQL